MLLETAISSSFRAICHPCLSSAHQEPAPHHNRGNNSKRLKHLLKVHGQQDTQAAGFASGFQTLPRDEKRKGISISCPSSLFCSIRRTDPKPCCLVILETSLEVDSNGEHVTLRGHCFDCIRFNKMPAHRLIIMKVLCAVMKHRISSTTQIWLPSVKIGFVVIAVV